MCCLGRPFVKHTCNIQTTSVTICLPRFKRQQRECSQLFVLKIDYCNMYFKLNFLHLFRPCQKIETCCNNCKNNYIWIKIYCRPCNSTNNTTQPRRSFPFFVKHCNLRKCFNYFQIIIDIVAVYCEMMEEEEGSSKKSLELPWERKMHPNESHVLQKLSSNLVNSLFWFRKTLENIAKNILLPTNSSIFLDIYNQHFSTEKFEIFPVSFPDFRDLWNFYP